MKYFFRVGLVLLVFLAVIGCSGRDFESNVMKGYYEAPKITVNSPKQDSMNGGIVDLDVDISDASGIGNIQISINTGSDKGNYGFNIDPKGAKSYNLKQVIFAILESHDTRPKGMSIQIQAWDTTGKEAYEEVYFQVDYEPFDLNVNSPSYNSGLDTFWTNNVNLFTSGNTWNTNATVTNVSLYIRDKDGQDDKVIYLGVSDWSKTITLEENKVSHLEFVAIDDSSAIAVQYRKVVVDKIAPTVQFMSPNNTGGVPSVAKTAEFEVQVNDNEFEDEHGWGPERKLKLYYKKGTSTMWNTNDYIMPNSPHIFTIWFSGAVETNQTNTIYAFAVDEAGNTSSTQSIQVFVDPTIPYVQINNPLDWTYTNATTIIVSGYAEVDAAYQIDSVEISVNGGAWQNITITASSGVNWNTTITLVANQENKVKVRATASNGKSTESREYTYIVDTELPTYNSYTVDNIQSGRIVNSSYYYWHIVLTDNMGLNYMTIDTYSNNNWYQVKWEDLNGDQNVSRDDWLCFELGGYISNRIRIYDFANNMREFYHAVEMWPAVFVANWGNAGADGYGSDPLMHIQDGINKAEQLGIGEVRIHEGTYTINTSITLVDNVDLRSGYYNNFLTHGHYNRAMIDGNNNIDHLIIGNSINDVDIFWIDLTDGGTDASADINTEYGGGIFLHNCQNIRLDSVIISSCKATNGAAIYTKDSSLCLANVKVENNMGVIVSGAYFEMSDIRHEWGCSYSNNNISDYSNAKVLYAKDCWTLIVSNVNFGGNMSGASMGALSSIWLEGANGNVVIEGCSFGNEGNVAMITPYNIYLNGSPGSLSIVNNQFWPNMMGANTFGIYEAFPINGHIFMNNMFEDTTMYFQAVYYDSVNLGSLNAGDINDFAWTGALDGWGSGNTLMP